MQITSHLRIKIIELLYSSHSGHIGSSLSCIDILYVLYKYSLKKGDKAILSKGHAVPALYVVLHQLGILSDKTYKNFHEDGTLLPAHPPNNFHDVIPFPTGSLGHGLSLSAGIAEGYILNNKRNPNFIYCLMSDGECNEGSVWEAAQYASKHHLYNLVALVDKNKIQAFGRTIDVLGDSASREKWEAFGFEVFECDGHNVKKLRTLLGDIRRKKSNKPRMIVCNTIKGKGVSFMENTIDWHYLTMNESQYTQAILELTTKSTKSI